jgi:hypothetical protein
MWLPFFTPNYSLLKLGKVHKSWVLFGQEFKKLISRFCCSDCVLVDHFLLSLTSNAIINSPKGAKEDLRKVAKNTGAAQADQKPAEKFNDLIWICDIDEVSHK